LKLIDRYILKDFLGPFVVSTVALTFILLMDQLFKLVDLIVRKGINIWIVAQVFFLSLPFVIAFTAPMGVLIAAIMVFGRLSSDNEITALRIQGLSFLKLTTWPLVFSVTLFFFLVVFNNTVLPESNHRVRNLLLDVSSKKPAIRLPEGVFASEFPGYTIYIGRKDEKTNRVFDVTVYDNTNNIFITAPRGEIVVSPDERVLTFVLYDGENHELVEGDRYRRVVFGRYEINLPLNTELIRKERLYRSDREMTYGMLRTKATDAKKEIRSLKKEIGELEVQVGSDTVKLVCRETAKIRVEQRRSELHFKFKQYNRFLVEIYKKVSIPFVCIIFLLLGAGVGNTVKRGGMLGVLISILLFSLYYILILVGEELADRNTISPLLGMWLPNFVMSVFALDFLYHAEYEQSFILARLLGRKR